MEMRERMLCVEHEALPQPRRCSTHWCLTAVGKDLKHCIFLTGVYTGQVIKRGVDRSIGPFSELPGQVSALGVFDLSSEDVSENLIAKEQYNQRFSANGLLIPQPLHNTGVVISP